MHVHLLQAAQLRTKCLPDSISERAAKYQWLSRIKNANFMVLLIFDPMEKKKK